MTKKIVSEITYSIILLKTFTKKIRCAIQSLFYALLCPHAHAALWNFKCFTNYLLIYTVRFELILDLGYFLVDIYYLDPKVY